MSEPKPLIPPYVLDNFVTALEKGEPRAFELGYALALALPRDEIPEMLAAKLPAIGEAPPELLAVEVRATLEEAAYKYEVLASGNFEIVDLNNPNVLAFERTRGDERLLIVNNLAPVSQPIKFSKYSGHAGWDILNRIEFAFPARAQLEDYEFLWLLLE